MCGIAGIMYRGSDQSFHTGQALIQMLDGCQHRGPDSTGYALYGEEHRNELKLRFLVGEGTAAKIPLPNLSNAIGFDHDICPYGSASIG